MNTVNLRRATAIRAWMPVVLAAIVAAAMLASPPGASAAPESNCNVNTQRENASATWYPYEWIADATVRNAAMSAVKQFRDGDRYEFGTCGAVRYADGKQRFDCSGLVWWAYHNAYKEFTRRSADGLYRAGSDWPKHENGRRVGLWEVKPGDLIFWNTDANPATVDHVGMYLGTNTQNGKREFVEALNQTAGLRISDFAQRQAGIMPEAVRVVG